MSEFSLLIFAANNLTNPQNPGYLPAEDYTYRSDLVTGDQITWNGGGESAFVTVFDPIDTIFDEAKSNQTLANGVTFDGVTYSAGQIVTPTYTIVFSGSDGNSYTMTSFNFSGNTNNEVPDAVFWEGSVPPPGTVLTVTSEINPTSANSREYEDFVTCFCPGTRIETQDGLKPVEALTTGDSVLTERGEFEKILMVCQRHVTAPELAANPKLRPVVISKGALGGGLPLRNLRVSRQHRFCVSSPICKRMFGKDEVLVSAIQLTKLPGIYIDDDAADVRYFHILLQQHDVIFAEGALAESLYLGPNTLHSMKSDALEEIRTLFPGLVENKLSLETAHYIPQGKRQKKLISRIFKNGKSVLEKSRA